MQQQDALGRQAGGQVGVVLRLDQQQHAGAALVDDVQRQLCAELIRQGRADDDDVEGALQQHTPRLRHAGGGAQRRVAILRQQLPEGRMEFGRGRYHQHTVGAPAVVHVRPSFRGR